MDSTKEVEIPKEAEEETKETYDNIMYPGLEDGKLTLTLTATELGVLIGLLEFTKDIAVVMRVEGQKNPKFNPQALMAITTNTDYFMDKIMDKAEVGWFDDTPTH